MACDKRRRTMLEVDLDAGVVVRRTTAHHPPKLEHLNPKPRPGTLSAQTPTGLAWVSHGPQDDADIWWAPSDGTPPRPLDVGPGDQHHPVAYGDWLAWVSFSDIKMWNTATGERKKLTASTGFNSPPSLGDGIACWEVRGAEDVDLRCSNGFSLSRPGHQTYPQILGARLLFREHGRLLSIQIQDAP